MFTKRKIRNKRLIKEAHSYLDHLYNLCFRILTFQLIEHIENLYFRNLCYITDIFLFLLQCYIVFHNRFLSYFGFIVLYITLLVIILNLISKISVKVYIMDPVW